MAKQYSLIINGVEVFVSQDNKHEYSVRICVGGVNSTVGHKTFMVTWEPSEMLIKAIMAPYAVLIGEDPNIELAIGFNNKDMAVCWMNQLPEEDAKKAYCITTGAFLNGDYRYL